MQSLIGTGVAVVTPFTVNKEVDFPALRRVIKHLIDGKVEYLVMLGTTGETATLTQDESLKIVETFFEEAEGKIPLVMGIGGNNTASIVKKVEDHHKRFPQTEAILSVSPYYNKPGQEGIYRHYKAVAEASPLPLILYNVPPRTSSNVSAETTLRLAHDLKNVVAMKEASGDLDQCMRIVAGKPKDFLLLSGDDTMSLPMISIGGKGTISVSANAFPFQFSEMVRSAIDGHAEKAQQLHYSLYQIMKLHFKEGNPSGVKTAMALQGICENWVRLPLIEATEKLAEEMKRLVNELIVSK
ncbi:MAG: 4-hydroxy-tetrahydrodipicolinate synthase [Bacteroidia bacterium]|nr:4-hydroxy-tetrahydrodipicolinate synthase [Bacteroidia bacterium]